MFVEAVEGLRDGAGQAGGEGRRDLASASEPLTRDQIEAQNFRKMVPPLLF